MEAGAKNKIHEALLDYIQANPLPAEKVPSPYWHKGLAVWGRPAAAALFVAIFLVTGVTSAAEKSLPGDILYHIKTDITEPVRAALLTTQKESVDWRLTQAERRLDEALALAKEDRLTPNIEEDLALRFEQHLALAQKETSTADDQSTTNPASDNAEDTSDTSQATMSLGISAETNNRSAKMLSPLAANIDPESKSSLPAQFIADLENYKQKFQGISAGKTPNLIIKKISEKLIEVDNKTTETVNTAIPKLTPPSANTDTKPQGYTNPNEEVKTSTGTEEEASVSTPLDKLLDSLKPKTNTENSDGEENNQTEEEKPTPKIEIKIPTTLDTGLSL